MACQHRTPNWQRMGYNGRKQCSDLLIAIVSREEEQWTALRMPMPVCRLIGEEEMDRIATHPLKTRT
ncbi:hypothetical protein ccbrp13_11940 [Ktedonobacteria bacterium brp13]|nr:hypothetical protein ccbrp13_11940 [Ktedonobacteria bacterium brp13]